MSTLRANSIQNTSGVEQYLAKAWVNFNGTGTVAIRAAGNVSSITDNGVGDYTVNFTSALADANYSAVITTGDTANLIYGALAVVASPQTTTAARFQTRNGITPLADAAFVNVAIFR